MTMTSKQAIFEAIEQLPEQHLADVLQYIQQLSSSQKSPTHSHQRPTSRIHRRSISWLPGYQLRR
jgi:Bromodomain extra-terminal - transcription regulation